MSRGEKVWRLEGEKLEGIRIRTRTGIRIEAEEQRDWEKHVVRELICSPSVTLRNEFLLLAVASNLGVLGLGPKGSH